MKGQQTPAGDLRLVDLTKRFGVFTAVDDLTLTIPQGSFFALLGASGCGKTTTLRMIAGLEQPTSGKVLLGEQDIAGLRPYKRPVNTVFQSYALFPHLDIHENVAFGLRRRGIRKVGDQVERMLALVQLEGYGRRRPAQLSGGQQQRVALARALINHPQVLLLDEPLGALDLKLRRQMQIELKRIQTEVGITFVHVTHTQPEAIALADMVVVMDTGRIDQADTANVIFNKPKTPYVARFMGGQNVLTGTVESNSGGVFKLKSADGSTFEAKAGDETSSAGSKLSVSVRRDHVALRRGDGTTEVNSIAGVVDATEYQGSYVKVTINTAGGVFVANVSDRAYFAEPVDTGDKVVASWSTEDVHILSKADTGVAGDPYLDGGH